MQTIPACSLWSTRPCLTCVVFLLRTGFRFGSHFGQSQPIRTGGPTQQYRWGLRTLRSASGRNIEKIYQKATRLKQLKWLTITRGSRCTVFPSLTHTHSLSLSLSVCLYRLSQSVNSNLHKQHSLFLRTFHSVLDIAHLSSLPMCLSAKNV